MKYLLNLFIVPVFFFGSCKNDTAKEPVSTKAGTTPAEDTLTGKKEGFFPVADYIGGQLKMIDSLQLPLSMAVTINNKTRYAVATDKQLKQWASNFQQPDINDPSLRSQYKETNIADESGPSVTLIYTAINSTLPVQKINVFIKPDPVQNDKVTGVYIEKTFSLSDTMVNQKLFWKAGKSLQVTTEKKVKSGTLPVEQVKITWDPS